MLTHDDVTRVLPVVPGYSCALLMERKMGSAHASHLADLAHGLLSELHLEELLRPCSFSRCGSLPSWGCTSPSTSRWRQNWPLLLGRRTDVSRREGRTETLLLRSCCPYIAPLSRCRDCHQKLFFPIQKLSCISWNVLLSFCFLFVCSSCCCCRCFLSELLFVVFPFFSALRFV